jgi:hypothetical protein
MKYRSGFQTFPVRGPLEIILIYCRGGQPSLLAGQIQAMKNTAGRKFLKKNVVYFKPKTGHIKVFSLKLCSKSTYTVC